LAPELASLVVVKPAAVLFEVEDQSYLEARTRDSHADPAIFRQRDGFGEVRAVNWAPVR